MKIDIISPGQLSEKTRHDQILQFIKQHDLGVLCSRTQNGEVQGAIVEILPTHNLELVFATHLESRKCKNIRHNKNIAFVIGSYEEVSIQFEGICTEVERNSNEYHLYAKQLASKLRDNYFPLANEEEFVVFRARPMWIRYSDVAQKPWDIAEIDFPLKKQMEEEKNKYHFRFSLS